MTTYECISQAICINNFNSTYAVGSFEAVCSSTCRAEVVMKQGDTKSRGLGIVRVEVGKVGKVDGRAVVDGLQSATSVEVTDCLGLILLLSSRAFASIDSSSESTRVCQVISRQTAHELCLYQSCKA
jgi:hypothetical protein